MRIAKITELIKTSINLAKLRYYANVMGDLSKKLKNVFLNLSNFYELNMFKMRIYIIYLKVYAI